MINNQVKRENMTKQNKTEKKYNKELFVMVQEKLYIDFQSTCEENYKTMSEVIRDFMLKYIKENKKT